MNTRRNETIGCNLVNGRGSRDEHGRQAVTPGHTDEIETYSEWIVGSTLFSPFRPIYPPVPGHSVAAGQENGIIPDQITAYVGYLKPFPPCLPEAPTTGFHELYEHHGASSRYHVANRSLTNLGSRYRDRGNEERKKGKKREKTLAIVAILATLVSRRRARECSGLFDSRRGRHGEKT